MEIKSGGEIEEITSKMTRATGDAFLIELALKFRKNGVIQLDNTGRVATACIGSDEPGRHVMYFGEKFVEQELEDADDLFFVYMHECFHMLNGDLLRQGSWIRGGNLRAEYNILFDIKINSEIVRNYFGAGASFLKRFYVHEPQSVVGFMLSPPFTAEELKKRKPAQIRRLRQRLAKAAEESVFLDQEIITDRKLFAELCVSAWYDRRSAEDLAKTMQMAVKLPQKQCYRLLGGHFGGQGRGDSYTINIEKEKISKENMAIIEAVRRAAEGEGSARVESSVIAASRGVLPSFGRREALMLAGGCYPFFFRNELEQITAAEREISLYVDVSGSLGPDISFIYGLLAAIKTRLGRVIYLFSTKVDEITIPEFLSGKVKTDYGTNFNAVFSHALGRGVRRMIMITDGYGGVKAGMREDLKKSGTELYILFTGYAQHSAVQQLKNMAKAWWVVER